MREQLCVRAYAAAEHDELDVRDGRDRRDVQRDPARLLAHDLPRDGIAVSRGFEHRPRVIRRCEHSPTTRGELRGGVAQRGRARIDLLLEPDGDVAEALLVEAGADGPVAHAELLLAGVDFPAEVEAVQGRAQERGWADHVEVANDTFAVLRAGTDRGWGVAVVCGAGMNCLGVSPDGRHVRFPALGPITGDWGGGQDVGAAAVWAAARSQDGRGPQTTLDRAVPEHFGLVTPLQLAEAVHTGEVSHRRFVELAPLVLAEAATDAVAAEIVTRQAGEVVAFVRVALERIGVVDEPADVVLGGGLMQARDPQLLAAIEAGLADLEIPHSLVVVDAPPVVGAALRALDVVGAEPAAHARLRTALAGDERLAEVTLG